MICFSSVDTRVVVNALVWLRGLTLDNLVAVNKTDRICYLST